MPALKIQTDPLPTSVNSQPPAFDGLRPLTCWPQACRYTAVGPYPASSLKERVYALSGSRTGGHIDRCGILIYTASAGAQGTLGGLVATAPRFAQILKSALNRLKICSNDPVCADHEPDEKSGDRATHGAACHGCLLIAETSCEMKNLFLDRGLLVPTMTDELSCFFK